MQAQEAGAVLSPHLPGKQHRFTPEKARLANEVKQAKRRQSLTVPLVTPLTPQAIANTHKHGIEEWIKIASHFRRDIREAQRSGDKKGVVALLTAAGIAWDKAYPSKQVDESTLIAPQPVVSRLIELAVAQSVPSDNNELHDSLHNASYATGGDSLSSSNIEHEAGGDGLGEPPPAP